MSWTAVGTLDSIPRRGARVLRLGGLDIAVFRTGDGAVFALEDRCPHRDGPLSQGIVHGHCVTCPLHDWVIDLTSGAATGPDEGATRRFDVRIDGERVLVRVDAPIDAAPLTSGAVGSGKAPAAGTRALPELAVADEV